MVNQIDPLLMTSLYQQQERNEKALCIAIIDESNDDPPEPNTEASHNANWQNFKALYPERSFILLQVNGTTNGSFTGGHTESPFPDNTTAAQYGEGLYDEYDEPPPYGAGPSDGSPLPSELLADIKTDPKYAYVPNVQIMNQWVVNEQYPTSTADPDWGRTDRVYNFNGGNYWFRKRTNSYVNLDGIGALGGKNFGSPLEQGFLPQTNYEIEWSKDIFDIINNYVMDLSNPSDYNNRIFLFIDDSGSHNLEESLGSYIKFLKRCKDEGYKVQLVYNGDENYIGVFDGFTGEVVTYDSESAKYGLVDGVDNAYDLTVSQGFMNDYNVREDRYKYGNDLLLFDPTDTTSTSDPQNISKGEAVRYIINNSSYDNYPLRLFRGDALNQRNISFISNTNPTRITCTSSHNCVNGDLIAVYGSGIPSGHPLKNRAFFVKVIDSLAIELYTSKSQHFYSSLTDPNLDPLSAVDSSPASYDFRNIGTFAGSYIRRYQPVISLRDQYVSSISSVINGATSGYTTTLSIDSNGFQVDASSTTGKFYTNINTNHDDFEVGNTNYLLTCTKNSVMCFHLNIT